MSNTCVFSPCRSFRYRLEHSWAGLWPQKTITWIGLNPSTADEEQLDPTLRRIQRFSEQLGFNTFLMLNLFAYRATDPREKKAAKDPIGPENEKWIIGTAKGSELVVAAWGSHGGYMDRSIKTLNLLRDAKISVHSLGVTKDGFPCHPLYLKGDTQLGPLCVT